MEPQLIPPPMPPMSDDERRAVREALYWIFLAVALLCLAAVAALWSGRIWLGWPRSTYAVGGYLGFIAFYALLHCFLLAPASWDFLAGEE